MEGLTSFLSTIGEQVEDAEEVHDIKTCTHVNPSTLESFLLFSQSIPSSNLGFVDSKSTTIDLTIHDQEYTIHQSPTLLSSSRAGGTTGAVIWKITPLFAKWLSSLKNPLWTEGVLTPSSTIVELGCGISALTALTLAPLLNDGGHYLATDQEYVQKLFRTNLEANPPFASRTKGRAKTSSSKGKSSKGSKTASATSSTSSGKDNLHPNITLTSLDWETDIPDTLKSQIQSNETAADDLGDEDKGFDLLISCDCIYNDALIPPFVRTCAEIARLRPSYSSFSSSSETGSSTKCPTICIIAQQQRSPEVFEAWLMETMRYFHVWRVREDILGREMGVDSGYLVHVLLVK
ncbi:hypothetical protein BJX70DRAFT_393334 [Aspergillus crustosus]